MNNIEAAISKIDALTLLETIYQCGLCKTVQDASAIMQKVNALLDFDNAVYVLARYNKKGSIDKYSTINFSYPTEWLIHYKKKSSIQKILLPWKIFLISACSIGLILK